MPSTLLIRCAQSEVEIIKHRARQERRSINAHVLNILARALRFEASPQRIPEVRKLPNTSGDYVRPPGSRTVVFLRCTKDEAERIRRAAAIRLMPINEYVLTRLARSYEIQDRWLAENKHLSPVKD